MVESAERGPLDLSIGTFLPLLLPSMLAVGRVGLGYTGQLVRSSLGFKDLPLGRVLWLTRGVVAGWEETTGMRELGLVMEQARQKRKTRKTRQGASSRQKAIVGADILLLKGHEDDLVELLPVLAIEEVLSSGASDGSGVETRIAVDAGADGTEGDGLQVALHGQSES